MGYTWDASGPSMLYGSRRDALTSPSPTEPAELTPQQRREAYFSQSSAEPEILAEVTAHAKRYPWVAIAVTVAVVGAVALYVITKKRSRR